MAIFSMTQFIFAPIWGRVSDRVGRRPILLVGLVGSVAFYALFGYASDLPETAAWAGLALMLLFISRAGAGVAGATIATAQAVIADCTTPEHRKHGMALIGMAFGIGFTFGPLVAVASLYFFPTHKGVVGYFAAGLSSDRPDSRHHPPAGDAEIQRSAAVAAKVVRLAGRSICLGQSGGRSRSYGCSSSPRSASPCSR